MVESNNLENVINAPHIDRIDCTTLHCNIMQCNAMQCNTLHCTHSLTHSLTYSLTHSLTYSLTHSLTHSLTYSLTHSLTHTDSDLETQRCIAYALCNLAADPRRRADIVREGGLPSLISLACSDAQSDQLTAMSTIRAVCAQSDVRRIVLQANILDALSVGARANSDDVSEKRLYIV